MGLDGTGQFRLTPELVELRSGVLERAWNAVRLQKQFADKIGRIRMDMRVAGEAPRWTIADPTRCCQVLMNLLANAIKFTTAEDGSGFVEMIVDYCPETEARALGRESEAALLQQQQQQGAARSKGTTIRALTHGGRLTPRAPRPPRRC